MRGEFGVEIFNEAQRNPGSSRTEEELLRGRSKRMIRGMEVVDGAWPRILSMEDGGGSVGDCKCGQKQAATARRFGMRSRRGKAKLTMMGEEPSINVDMAMGVALTVSFHVIWGEGRGRGRGQSCPA